MNIEKIRKDTRFCEDKLFLNSAGSSLVPAIVTKKMKEFLDAEEEIGGYKLVETRIEEIKEFNIEIGKLLNAKSANISYAYSATDAYSKALSCIPWKAGDVIITTNNDYTSNFLQFINLENRFGVVIKRIDSLEDGDLNIAHLEQLILEKRPTLIAVTEIPTNSGLIQDIVAVGEICAREGILYLVDACQSVGQIPVDVQKIKCDFLTATGRKFMRGPRGTGFLFASDRILERGYSPLCLDGAGAEWTAHNKYKLQPTAQRFTLFELPFASLIGLKEATRYANEVGLENIAAQNQKIGTQLRGNLSAIPGVQLHDKGDRLASIITFTKEGISKEQMIAGLDDHRVFYSLSSRQHAVIDFEEKGLDWVIRFSPHYFNTLEEMDRVAEIVERI